MHSELLLLVLRSEILNLILVASGKEFGNVEQAASCYAERADCLTVATFV